MREIKVEETLAAVVLKELLENRKQLRPNVGDNDGHILEPCLNLRVFGGQGDDKCPCPRKLRASTACWSDDARAVNRQKL